MQDQVQHPNSLGNIFLNKVKKNSAKKFFKVHSEINT
ncbi:unnamed protein product [Linum tenue]|uniref:Uncharacterized protein n=1 Tax=Linum tenue TaxID=586396 RepID=A0AAV0NSB6_9ROSI|nr:unnamed protein product [Linum tenue]